MAVFAANRLGIVARGADESAHPQIFGDALTKTRFIVVQAKGPSWDPTRLRREQALWDEHAAFMDKLTAEGFIVLGGPLGEGDGEDALLVVEAPDEGAIVSILRDDPWSKMEILKIKTIQRWTVFLGAEKV